MSDERSTHDGPWCWLGKAELRRLADACEDRTDRAHVLAVYVALSWIASDRQAEKFSEPIGRIAERAGVSYRKCEGVLALLKRIGLVGIASNVIPGTSERGPNTYTLRTVCATSGTECVRLGTAEIPPCRDYKKNPVKNPAKNVAQRFAAPTLADWLAYSDEQQWPRGDAESAFDYYVANGWVQGRGKPIRDWKAAARNCQRRSRNPSGPAQSEAPLRFIET